MKIQALSNKLSQLISNAQRQKRKVRLGILAPNQYRAQPNQISELIRINMVEPIVRDLQLNTKKNIAYQLGTSIGFYYLLANNKKFAIMCVPNPALGIVSIKFLSQEGKQCTSSTRLYDTCQIIDYLKEFTI